MPFIEIKDTDFKPGEFYYSEEIGQRFCVLADLPDWEPEHLNISPVSQFKILWDDGEVTDETSYAIGRVCRVEALYRAKGVLEALYRAREVLAS